MDQLEEISSVEGVAGTTGRWKRTRDKAVRKTRADNFFLAKRWLIISTVHVPRPQEKKRKEKRKYVYLDRIEWWQQQFVQLKISLGKALLSQIINDYTTEKS